MLIGLVGVFATLTILSISVWALQKVFPYKTEKEEDKG